MGSPPPKPFYPYLHVLSEGGREERSKGRLERPWGAKARCSGQFPGGKRAQSDGPEPTRAGREGEAQTLCSHPGSGVVTFFSSICASSLRWPTEHLRGPFVGKELVTPLARTASFFPKGM